MERYYARALLEKSTFTGLPQIARSRGWTRRIKLLLLFFCLAGFIIQGGLFLQIFRDYAVTLVINFEYPTSVLVPAVTFCTGHKLKRQKYCNHYPNRCTSNLTVKKEFKNDLKVPSLEMMREFGWTWKEIYFIADLAWSPLPYFEKDSEEFVYLVDEVGNTQPCFLHNHQIWRYNESALQLPTVGTHLLKGFQNSIRLGVFMDYNTSLNPQPLPFDAALHTPYEMVNPYLEGFSIAMGQVNSINMKVIEIRRLPPPYRTDCMDYAKEWLKTRKGPLSKKFCTHQCIYQRTKEYCQCFPLGTLYPADIRFCEEADAKCLDQIDVQDCYEKCKEDCISYIYDIFVTNRQIEKTMDIFMRLLTDDAEYAEVDHIKAIDQLGGFAFFLNSGLKVVYEYKPKYEVIELFSYLGGYVGIWLGISLISVMDVVEISFKVAQHYVKSRKDPS